MKEYSAKYTAQRTRNEIEARSSGSKNHVKTIKFDGATEKVNHMASHDELIPRKKKVKNKGKY